MTGRERLPRHGSHARGFPEMGVPPGQVIHSIILWLFQTNILWPTIDILLWSSLLQGTVQRWRDGRAEEMFWHWKFPGPRHIVKSCPLQNNILLWIWSQIITIGTIWMLIRKSFRRSCSHEAPARMVDFKWLSGGSQVKTVWYKALLTAIIIIQ